MTPTPRHEGEAAVSTVLGAILVFGLLVLTLVMVQVNFVPVWDKQRESNFSLQIGTQMNTVRADMDRLVANATNGPFSDPITLTRQTGFTFFSNGLLPATVTFTPSSSSAGMTVATSRPFVIQASGGKSLAGLGEDYTKWPAGPGAPGGIDTISNVVAISHMRLRVANPVGTPAVGVPSATLTLLVTDVNGKCAGKLVLEERAIVEPHLATTDKNIQVQVYAADNPPTATCTTLINTRDDIIRCYGGATCPNSLPNYYLDALDSSLEFTSVLAAAASPLQLVLTGSGLTGAGAIAYDTTTSGGTIHVGATGQTLSSYNNFIGSGAMTVIVPYQQLGQQKFTFEYGGVFLEQADGTALLVPPQFFVSTTATQANLAWSFAALGGGSSAINGARQAYVGLTGSDSGVQLQAAASDLTFTISTSHPSVWAGFWDQQMQLAGLTSLASFTPLAPCTVTPNSPQYTITQTATSATLNFFGPCSDPNDTTHKDVFFTMHEAGVSVTLQPSG